MLYELMRDGEKAIAEKHQIADLEAIGFELAEATEDDSEGVSDEDILKALDALDHDNDAHWTKGGKPDMKTLEEMVGDSSITRKQVNELSDLERKE